jgi:hypothetical protein
MTYNFLIIQIIKYNIKINNNNNLNIYKIYEILNDVLSYDASHFPF